MDTLRRVRLRTGFAWQNTTDPLAVAARSALDTRLRRPAAQASFAGPDGPSIGYAGIADGLVRIQQQLERQREQAPGAETVRRDSYPAGWASLLSGRWLPPTDLVAVGCTREQARLLPAQAALVLPYRMNLVVDLAGGADQWRRDVSRREREWFASRRKARGWKLEFARDEASFGYFYDRMHQPTMQARHGERTRSEARERAYECLFRGGLLAFVTDAAGERLGGVLCHWDGRRGILTIRLLGVDRGSPELHADGVLRACYHLLLEWADRNGVGRVDFGGTEAWISKGIFQWKRKLGPRAVPAPGLPGRLRVWWHARRDTPAVRDFLVAHPVLEPHPQDGAGLRAVYFHDDLRPARTGLSYRLANVRDQRTVHLDDFLKGRPTDAPHP